MHGFNSFLHIRVDLRAVALVSPAAKVLGSSKSTGKNKSIKIRCFKFTKWLDVSSCAPCGFSENIPRFTCRLLMIMIHQMVLLNIRGETLI